ncbi:complement receptor type 2-like isoform X2 [Sceloporus undulatus]|uniref:complement receptor type 2-like isoform X2 n=1 Tax=Sceloporus undulatus TaxID=8520 RepID=UPI001C4C1217|nr:complement receptor type 2-like isoform X2 [Sceloporus undulatus]
MILVPCCPLLLMFLLSGVQGDCTTPPKQPHATLRNGELKDSYSVGTVLQYTCILGYKFIDRSNPSIRCLNNSEWSTTPTFCEGKQCKAPFVENGRIESMGDLRLGEEITYVCDQGYRPIGRTTARCTLFEGNKVLWDIDPPLCARIPCERPPTILNGTHSGDTSLDHYTVGDVVTYSCGRDLSLIGNSSIVCITAKDGVNGIWDRPAPECKAIQCSRPQIQNGRLTSAFQPIYNHERVLQFVCDSGYSLVGTEFVKCGADSMWHPELPTCVKVVECSRPQIQNGKLTTGFQPSYPYEHVLQFVCDSGYSLVGNKFVKCGADSMWHPEFPTCVKDILTTHLTSTPTPNVYPARDKKNETSGDCPAPENPPHATLIGGELNDSYPVGTVLKYNCIPGYQLIVGSNPSIECLDNSTWSQTPTFCELKRCKVPVLENGKIETSGNLELGDEVTFVCDEGYRLIGAETARCTLYGNKVEWDTTPPLCERIPCERPPTIANGSHSGDESLDHYTVGTVITYTCDKDFSLIGDSSIICIVAQDGLTGTWDKSPPECKVVQCSRPQIQNGKLTTGFQPSYQYEHVLQFVCDVGYTMVGIEFVKCGADNMWHPELPTCVKDNLTTHSTSTSTPTSTPTVHPEGDKKNETSGVIIQPTIKTTKEIFSSGPTRNPSGIVTKGESGNNNSVAIVAVLCEEKIKEEK